MRDIFKPIVVKHVNKSYSFLLSHPRRVYSVISVLTVCDVKVEMRKDIQTYHLVFREYQCIHVNTFNDPCLSLYLSISLSISLSLDLFISISIYLLSIIH